MKKIKMIVSALSLTLIFVLGGCGAVQASKPSVASAISPAAHSQTSNTKDSSDAAVNGSGNTTGILTIGKPAPDESLMSEKSMHEVKLSSFIGKKPLIINAWASWCPPCQEETPDFVKMFAKYGSNVQFVGVNLTSLDSISNAKSFVEKYAIPYPILLDTKGSFYRDYTVIAEPMTYVISPSGKVLSIHIGALLRIPDQIGHRIRKMSATRSTNYRPAIPVNSGHLFR